MFAVATYIAIVMTVLSRLFTNKQQTVKLFRVAKLLIANIICIYFEIFEY